MLTPGPWSVVSVLDGHLVTRVPFVPSTQTATLIGARAYCLSVSLEKKAFSDRPPARVAELHAIDLEAGRIAWKHSLGAVAPRRSPRP